LAGGLGDGKTLRIEARHDDRCPRLLRGDGRRLEQVLINLVGNAVKYTDAGSIVIKSRLRRRADGHVQLRLAVADTGAGIALDRLDRIGRPFEPLSRSSHGHVGSTGLGLAVVQQLLALFGSSLKLASVAGGGSIFWFDVSLREDEADDAPSLTSQPPGGLKVPASPGGMTPGMPWHVLVVDDSEIVRLALQAQLEALGAQVEVAADATTALAWVGARRFDWLLSDLQLPDRSGLDLLRHWRLHPGGCITRVALLSGHFPPQARAEAEALGVEACLLKPCRGDTLSALLSSAPITPRAAARSSDDAVQAIGIGSPLFRRSQPRPTR
jgi:two-component system, sensor histidine kinase